VPWLCCSIALAAFGCLFALALDAGLFIEAPASNFADYTFLLYFSGETPQKAFKALSFSKSDFGH
jgi:hypothetical protein